MKYLLLLLLLATCNPAKVDPDEPWEPIFEPGDCVKLVNLTNHEKSLLHFYKAAPFGRIIGLPDHGKGYYVDVTEMTGDNEVWLETSLTMEPKQTCLDLENGYNACGAKKK